MEWLIYGALAVLFCFSFVILFGAPYVPTLTPQVKTALDLTKLSKTDVFLELGCGDGKVLIAAANSGAQVVGYELNPILALIAWARTRRYGKQVQVVWGDFWKKQWPADTTVIFTFLHTRFMKRLDKKIVQYSFKKVKLASFAFAIPDRAPVIEKSGIFLYEYVATAAQK